MLARTLIGDDHGRATRKTRSVAMTLLQDAAAGDTGACRDLDRLLRASPSADADLDTARRLLAQAFGSGLREAARDLADHY